jgi:hypothetical protein
LMVFKMIGYGEVYQPGWLFAFVTYCSISDNQRAQTTDAKKDKYLLFNQIL